jgi:hypothetical protein
MRLNLTVTAFATTLTLAAAGSARAQQQPAEAEVAAGPLSPSGAAADPNIDRGFILPTAMTQPAGSVTYNNYELLLHGVTYGISDTVQATVTVLPPIVSGMPFLGGAAIKGRVSPAPMVHLAAQGMVWFLNDSSVQTDSGTTTSASAFSLGVGGYASFCLRQDCASLFNTSVNYQYAAPSTGSGAAHLVVYGGSLVVRASDHVKLLAEITSAAGRNDYGSFENVPGFLASYGLRFHSTSIAADVGFIKPIVTSNHGDDPFVLGLPFVNVSYRWN